jgi:hypothetical protein
VAEGMPPASFESERIEQGVQLPFHGQVCVPRRAVACPVTRRELARHTVVSRDH